MSVVVVVVAGVVLSGVVDVVVVVVVVNVVVSFLHEVVAVAICVFVCFHLVLLKKISRKCHFIAREKLYKCEKSFRKKLSENIRISIETFLKKKSPRIISYLI